MEKDKNKFNESKCNFILKYGGKDEIDAETLSLSLNGVVKTIKSITSNEYPDTHTKLKIINLGRGSFEITLSTVIYYAQALLPITNLALNVIDSYLSYIKIKRHLHGQQPKSIKYENNNAKIINQDNGTITENVYVTKNYFENCTFDNLISDTFNLLLTDEDRTGFKIIYGDKTKIDISKDEFNNMSTPIIEKEKDYQKKGNTIENIELPLKKPDLLGDSKWSFIIKNLYAGVKIPVKLRIEQEFNEEGLLIKDTEKYFVEKVNGDIIEPQDRQIKLNF
ncbi:MAG: hypothetical protein ACTSQS_19245 [Promethearchaeota archaeon]